MSIWKHKDRQDVVIQDSTSPLFQYFLMDEQKTDIILTSIINFEDEVINVSAGHGFTAAAGENIAVWEGNQFLQMEVKSVATNAITVTHPIAQYFTTNALVIRGNIDMNVDGSSSDKVFIMNLHTLTIPIDISKAVMTMQHGANVPDDGKFGGLPGLTNGMFFRKEGPTKFNLGNYKTNQAFIDTGAVVTYTAKAPAGTNATNIIFDIKQIFGQVIRMDARINDTFKGIVRDKIDAAEGMAKFTLSMIGSFTEGE